MKVFEINCKCINCNFSICICKRGADEHVTGRNIIVNISEKTNDNCNNNINTNINIKSQTKDNNTKTTITQKSAKP